MRPNGILTVDLLTILLVAVVLLLPNSAVRVVMAVPLVLFFPGYTLLSALFPRRQEITELEKIALGVGVSVAEVILVGLAFNYTPWGIQQESMLYSLALSVLVMSLVALVRGRSVDPEYRFTAVVRVGLPGWDGDRLNRILIGFVTLAVLCSVASVSYVVARPRTGEGYSEFYVVGSRGMAEDYPNRFTIKDGQVASVGYGSAAEIGAQIGQVTLGIVNRERRRTFLRHRPSNRWISGRNQLPGHTD